MKSKKNSKKLVFNKRTVSNLDEMQKLNVKGGVEVYPSHPLCCGEPTQTECTVDCGFTDEYSCLCTITLFTTPGCC